MTAPELQGDELQAYQAEAIGHLFAWLRGPLREALRQNAEEMEAAGVKVDPDKSHEKLEEAAACFTWWSIWTTAYDQQRDFISGSSASTQLFCGGRGTGKTWSGSLKALFLALLNPGVSMPGGGVKYCPGAILGRTALEVSAKLEANFLERIAEFKRATGIELVAWYNAKHRCYTLINGAVIFMLPYGREDTLAKVRGYDFAWAWADEIMFAEVDSLKAYQIILATLRYPLATEVQFAITSSPDGLVGVMAHCYEQYLQGNDDYYITSATVFDNPHVDDAFRERLKSGCTPAQWAAEGLGQLVKAANVIYSGFDRETHIVPWEYDKTLPVVLCLDWGDNWAWTGLANVVNRPNYRQGGRHFPPGSWIFYDERPMRDGSAQQQQEDIKDLARTVRGELALVAADKAKKAENNWLRGLYGMSATHGVKTLSGSDQQRRNYGINCVRYMLTPPSGPPLLYFAASLNPTIERNAGTIVSAMGSYGFKRVLDPLTGALLTTNRPEENTPPTHAVDGVRYGIVASAALPDLHGGHELRYAQVHAEPATTTRDQWTR